MSWRPVWSQGQGVKVIMALLTRVALILFAASGMPCLVGAVYTGRRMERFTNSLLLLVKELRPVHEQGGRAIY